MLERNPILLGTVLLAVASAPLAKSAAAGEGPYIGLKAAGADVEDSEANDVDIEFDTGFAISGQLGYQFPGFRLEGEFGYQGVEGVSENDINSDVDIGRFTLNGYADVPIAPNLGPYIGGGFGVASLSADDDFRDEDSAFTWHAEAGLNLDLTDQFTLSPFYRYQWIDTDIGGQSEPLVSHLFGVSLRYTLTWRGRPHRPGPYYGDYHRRGYYGPSYYGPGYGAYDRYYYDRDRFRYRDRDRRPSRSPEQRERDRCGWEGPGCEDEGGDGWEG